MWGNCANSPPGKRKVAGWRDEGGRDQRDGVKSLCGPVHVAVSLLNDAHRLRPCEVQIFTVPGFHFL